MGAFLLKEKLDDGHENEIFVVFSASDYPETIRLPKGDWEIHVTGEKAGTESLGTRNTKLTIPPITAVVLVRKVK